MLSIKLEDKDTGKLLEGEYDLIDEIKYPSASNFKLIKIDFYTLGDVEEFCDEMELDKNYEDVKSFISEEDLGQLVMNSFDPDKENNKENRLTFFNTLESWEINPYVFAKNFQKAGNGNSFMNNRIKELKKESVKQIIEKRKIKSYS
jgi:hypothetical protein